MKTKRLNIMDTAWLASETAKAPLHVGGLVTFHKPDDAPDDFCQQLVEHWRSFTTAYSPWSHRLRGNATKNVAPEWEVLDEIDVDYHFSHSSVPAPGGDRELGIVASRLHTHSLDFSRPPWECHLIEGLSNNRFAIYIKVHHSLVDGVTGMRMLAKSMAKSADDMDRPPFWATDMRKKKRNKSADKKPQPGVMQALSDLAGGARDQVASLPALASVLRDMIKAARSSNDALSLPFSAHSSVLNSRIDSRRAYATQLFSLEEFKELAHNAGGTANDVVLAICGGALRRYLLDLDKLPDKPLTAGIPVSVRPSDEEEGGNAMTFILASLATDVEDPEERFQAVAASTQRAKNNLEKLSASGITQYTVALMAPFVLSLITGMAGRTRPVFNVSVSNLPGPQERLFLRGAEMEAFYPTSLVTHGMGLTVTVHGYMDTLGFGFMGCGETLPDIQALADYTGEALEELRAIYGSGAGETQAASGGRQQSGKRKKTG